MINKYISILYRYGQIYLSKTLKPYGLSGGQYPFLLCIHKYPGISQENISKELAIDKGTTAKMVQKLVIGGFVKKESFKEDRRVHCLFLTERSKRALPFIKKALSEWYEVIMIDFSEEERQQASEYLKRMMENAWESLHL